jgi:putative photosynthetic complex assembly protein 2
LRRRTFVWSLAFFSALAGIALWGVSATGGDVGPAGAYCAFACGVAAWAWQIATFYLGFITGPRVTACDPSLRGWKRFAAGLQTCAHHEIAIVAMAILMVALLRDQPNHLGLWTYCVLWWMHASAKLNVFFGAPNLGAEFIPNHMRYLVSYMARRPMNLFFPVSVSASTVVAVVLAMKAAAADATAFEAAAYTMLTTLMALAILEHWLLVAPLDTTFLWKWGVKSTPGATFTGAESTPDKIIAPRSFSLANDEWARDASDYVRPAGGGLGAMESWSSSGPTVCDDVVLSRLLDSIGAGAFGEIHCVKGVLQTRKAWIRFETSGARADIASFAPPGRLDPLVVALGRRIDRVRLQAAFDACAVSQ